MMIVCPTCGTAAPLDSFTEDTAARELFALLAQAGAASSALVAYLSLFKPRKQALRWTRAAHLAREVLDIEVGRETLAAALVETVEALRERRQSPSWKPLSNHRYLQSVLASVSAASSSKAVQTPDKPHSKAAQAADALSRIEPPEGIDAWFSRAVLDGLALLWTSGLEGTPASDLVEVTAQRWIEFMWPKRSWQVNSYLHGAARIRRAFSDIAQGGRFPQPADVLGMIPRV